MCVWRRVGGREGTDVSMCVSGRMYVCVLCQENIMFVLTAVCVCVDEGGREGGG